MSLYRGFEAVSVFNEEQGLYIGHVANCSDTIVFYGFSPAQLENSFKFCVDTYLAICKEKGYCPSIASRSYQEVIEQETLIPFSKFTQRVGIQ